MLFAYVCSHVCQCKCVQVLLTCGFARLACRVQAISKIACTRVVCGLRAEGFWGWCGRRLGNAGGGGAEDGTDRAGVQSQVRAQRGQRHEACRSAVCASSHVTSGFVGHAATHTCVSGVRVLIRAKVAAKRGRSIFRLVRSHKCTCTCPGTVGNGPNPTLLLTSERAGAPLLSRLLACLRERCTWRDKLHRGVPPIMEPAAEGTGAGLLWVTSLTSLGCDPFPGGIKIGVKISRNFPSVTTTVRK